MRDTRGEAAHLLLAAVKLSTVSWPAVCFDGW